METNEFKDRLFDLLNETDNLPIQDLEADDINNRMNVYLDDGTKFSVYVENSGVSVSYYFCACGHALFAI